MKFQRFRRLRNHPHIRAMVRETLIAPEHLIAPIFVVHGEGVREEIPSLPGVFHLSIDEAIKECKELQSLGVLSVILFGLPSEKNATGSVASSADGITQRAFRAIRETCPDLYLIGDVCLCQYTDHGHCGLLESHYVVNDATLERLAETALAQVEAGAHMVAPSDMMDGRVGAIREKLDAHGHVEVPIMSYAAKFASAYYGPFREAAHSTPTFGDRKTYQMDPANGDQAILEVAADLQEGADIVMVKPALPYLDIIHRIGSRFDAPIAAYNVSGEYAMIKASAAAGLIDEEALMMESLLSIRRAGAQLIITYFAKDAATLLGRV